VRGCTGLCVAVVDSCPAPAACPLLKSRGCAWTGLCCRRPLRLRPLRPRRRRGALATTPTALPTTTRRDQVGRGRQAAGGRRRRNWSATNPDFVSAADLCSRVGPAWCFPRPPALISPARARFPPSSRSRAGRFPAREQRVFHRLDAFFDRLRAINLCHAIKRAPNHAQRLIQRLPPKRNAGPTFSV